VLERLRGAGPAPSGRGAMTPANQPLMANCGAGKPAPRKTATTRQVMGDSRLRPSCVLQTMYIVLRRPAGCDFRVLGCPRVCACDSTRRPQTPFCASASHQRVTRC